MDSFEKLLKEKNNRLEQIPLDLQTVVEKQQNKVLTNIISELETLTKVNGQIKINAENLRAISKISDELKSIFLNDEYLKAVQEFSKEFAVQATLNNKLIKSGFGEVETPLASKEYIDLAKKNAIDALSGSPAEVNFIYPIKGILENAVVNGASFSDTISAISLFVKGDKENESKILRYAKQITNDSFAIADRSYISIIADYLDSEWFYYSGTIVDHTRCFCAERVTHYFHRKEIESWGNGDNLGSCDIGGGEWAGMVKGTNSSTIFSYLGGYNCLHSLMPASEFGIPDEDMQRAKDLGYIK